MTDGVLPTWADIVAIGSALLSGAYSFGVIGQKVKNLEVSLKERNDRLANLETQLNALSVKVGQVETSVQNAVTLLTEVRNAVLYRPH